MDRVEFSARRHPEHRAVPGNAAMRGRPIEIAVRSLDQHHVRTLTIGTPLRRAKRVQASHRGVWRQAKHRARLIGAAELRRTVKIAVLSDDEGAGLETV